MSADVSFTSPVYGVRRVPLSQVEQNQYNPNSVAPPEMKLLELSIWEDGYTQPIVAYYDAERDIYVVVDGFHRHLVMHHSERVREREGGMLPIVVIDKDIASRMASTIRHNRARGKHRVEAMSDIVIELKRRNWSDEKIGRELGMDADEVLRLCQITGLAAVFKDQSFSEAWEVGHEESAPSEVLSDVIEGFQPKQRGRILHTWDKWECFRHGFYAERPRNGMSQENGERAYQDFLSDAGRFETALAVVTSEWKFSCEHYLTNERMNRIAWLGQASVAQALGIPSCCRGGYQRLTDKQKQSADALALKYLNKWLVAHDLPEIDHEQAGGRTEAELY